MRILPILVLAFFVFATVAPVMADNSIKIVDPYASGGAYGTGEGQIDIPRSVKVDANDNIYVLQQLHTNGARNKSVISVYSKDLTFQKSFEVLKTSMVDSGWDRAWSNFYYDDLASDFCIDREGRIFVLCGWDVVVMDSSGRYSYQFPVSSFMGWIDSSGSGDTQFYYPHGLEMTNDGYLVTTSGSSPKKHELIFITPDGKLFTKLDTPVYDIYNIAMDKEGGLYVIDADSNVVRSYDPLMTNEKDITLNFDKYKGNPSSMAFFSNGNFSASANGIFIFNNNGTVRDHFADNRIADGNKNWGKLITTNSEDSLIVVSGSKDASMTSKPIMVYKYNTGRLFGAEGRFGSPANLFGIAVLIFLAIIWLIGAVQIIRR